MRPRRTLTVLLAMAGVVLLFAGWTSATEHRHHYHSDLATWLYKVDNGGLVVQFSEYFVTAGRCAGCHGGDSLGFASVDSTGRDVNVADDWRSTMMANSARDPFFRAKMEHEGSVNPAQRTAIENKCTSCHAPLGMHEERMLGNPPFNGAMLDTSVIGQDGVSCLSCHQQDPDSAGHFFSGELHFDSARVYGPYPDEEIVPEIMEFFVGWRPGYGEHIQDSRVCAGCHTLQTATLDLNGSPTGDIFTEQATWHEWKNSNYYGVQSCRGCHMPRLQDSIVLAADYAFLSGHAPFGLHHLAGGNAFMLQLLKQHKDQIGVPATDTQFDSTITRTLVMLQQRSVHLDLELTSRTLDTAYIDVKLTDLAGHKFPSGYPSRRAFVQVLAITPQQDTLYANGLWDNTYEVIGHDSPYEPHHDVITDPGQVQIYEMVMGDVNGDVTTTLERALSPLKDNRLVPIGFSTTHYTYDTTLIAGVPASDVDFNHDALGTEGNGGDIVHYHVPLDGYDGPVQFTARVFFQPVPPAWNAEMFSYNGPRIDTFRTMYENADGTPILVTADSLSDDRTAIFGPDAVDVRIWPDPTTDGIVRITASEVELLDVFTADGRRCTVRKERHTDGWSVTLPPTSGVYLLRMRIQGRDTLRRVVRQ
ncbi:MAG: hypothetical protein H6597_01455 [Flavobacteriales bacterium]|nr:hypothetical protein [Flavobacteriales bacterium]MCB9193173.1 hypothetical protein [Flavobacteriales bacterium]